MQTLAERPASGDAPRRSLSKTKSSGENAKRRAPSVLALLQDLVASFRAPGFWLYGAWIDTSLQYRSQVLGAFWGIFGTLVFVLLLGTLYSAVLNNQNSSYYAYLASGYVVWGFMQVALLQSATIYTRNRTMIENGYVRYPDYVLRMVCVALNDLALNFIIVIGALVLVPVTITSAAFALCFTVPLFFTAILGACFLFSVLGARYADFAELLRTILRLGFFLTPILWMPGAHGGKAGAIGAFVYANPFYYLIEIIRSPLVDGYVPWLEIGVVAAATPVIWLLASVAYARARPYLPLWV